MWHTIDALSFRHAHFPTHHHGYSLFQDIVVILPITAPLFPWLLVSTVIISGVNHTSSDAPANAPVFHVQTRGGRSPWSRRDSRPEWLSIKPCLGRMVFSLWKAVEPSEALLAWFTASSGQARSNWALG